MKPSKLDHDSPPSPNYQRYIETYVKLSKDRTIFLSEDVTKEVEAIEGVKDRIKLMFEIISSKKCPEIKIGKI